MLPGAEDDPGPDREPFSNADAVRALGAVHEITTDPALTFEAKIDSLLSIGVDELDLPYAFLSRIAVEDLEGERGTQTIVDAAGDHELLQPGESAPLSRAYCRKTIKSEGLLAIRDAPEAGWEGDPAYETYDLGSYIGGKVELEDELYGTFCFASTAPREVDFSAAERTFVRVLSKWASYELQQQRQRERLERTNDRLENLASVVSHDLRNPLSVAEGRLELAREERDGEHLAAVAEAHERMGEIIDGLLSLARQGDSVGDTEPVSLGAVAEAAWETVRTDGVTLAVESDLELWADPSRLRQLLENLFRNAIEHGGEHCPPGAADAGVDTITVGAISGGFHVSDDGCGIPEAERETVLQAGASSDPDGLGLGLSIVSEVAAAHDWETAVREAESGGARFEFTGVDRVEE